MKINLYDAQNYFRVKLETEGTGMTIRGIYSEISASQDLDIMIWDGKGGNDRRREIYPDYKGKRKPAGESIWENLQLLKKVLNHTNCTQITVPGYEADDVIAHMAIRLFTHKMPIHIWSTDGDLIQLCEIPGVTHMRGQTYKNNEPNMIRLFKTCVGDASDNIGGIPGFGEKTWAMSNKEELLKFVKGEVADAANVGVKKSTADWMVQNRSIIEAMWTITGFFEIPKEEVDRHSVKGRPQEHIAGELLREFML